MGVEILLLYWALHEFVLCEDDPDLSPEDRRTPRSARAANFQGLKRKLFGEQQPQTDPIRKALAASYRVTTKGGDRQNIPSSIFLFNRQTINAGQQQQKEEEKGGQQDEGGGQRCRQGSKNYSKAEVHALLLKMQDMLPVGPEQWERLANAHADKWPGRDVNSIRRKYYSLCRRQKPTGNLTIRWEVVMARKIKRDIFEKRLWGEQQSYPNEEEEEDILTVDSTYVSSVARPSTKRSYISEQRDEMFNSINAFMKEEKELKAKLEADRAKRQKEWEANQAQIMRSFEEIAERIGGPPSKKTKIS